MSSKYRALDLTEEQIAEAVRDYLLGESADDIAVSLGVAHQTVIEWVRRAGGRVRGKGPGPMYLARRADM
jgi:transposase-like protein